MIPNLEIIMAVLVLAVQFSGGIRSRWALMMLRNNREELDVNLHIMNR